MYADHCIAGQPTVDMGKYLIPAVGVLNDDPMRHSPPIDLQQD